MVLFYCQKMIEKGTMFVCSYQTLYMAFQIRYWFQIEYYVNSSLRITLNMWFRLIFNSHENLLK